MPSGEKALGAGLQGMSEIGATCPGDPCPLRRKIGPEATKQHAEGSLRLARATLATWHTLSGSKAQSPQIVASDEAPIYLFKLVYYSW
jgi:hypothetical protein